MNDAMYSNATGSHFRPTNPVERIVSLINDTQASFKNRCLTLPFIFANQTECRTGSMFARPSRVSYRIRLPSLIVVPTTSAVAR